MGQCKHGLTAEVCAACGATYKVNDRRPKHSEQPIAFAVGTLDVERPNAEGRALIRTILGRDHCSIQSLGLETTFVHIDGSLYLWALEQILERAPNLKMIQVIPTAYSKLHAESHLRLCQERGVEIVVGHWKPELAWKETEHRSPHYEAQRRFLLNLRGDQKVLFDELRALNFEEVEMVARYFCLNGEDYVPQRVILEEYGFSRTDVSLISAKILAVFCYLDGTFPAGAISKQIAGAMQKRVLRLRRYLQSAQEHAKLIARLGVPTLAASFPLARVEVFEEILRAMREGRLAKLAEEHPKSHRVLVLRFGLDDLSKGTYRTLKEVGDMVGGVTRQRVLQIEEEALERLGITED